MTASHPSLLSRRAGDGSAQMIRVRVFPDAGNGLGREGEKRSTCPTESEVIA
jgi:hypothetical protein